jgi:hypothetical protein
MSFFPTKVCDGCVGQIHPKISIRPLARRMRNSLGLIWLALEGISPYNLQFGELAQLVRATES